MKARRIVTLLLVAAALCLAGCERNPDDVELMTEADVLEFVASSYGDASIVDISQSDETAGDDDRYVTYTLQDGEYGFEYTLTSSVRETVIDASRTGYYSEDTDCDFMDRYQEYIVGELDDLDFYSTSLYGNITDPGLFGIRVHGEGTSDAVSQGSDAAARVREIDGRGYFAAGHIDLYEGSDYLGSCAVSDGSFTNRYDEQIEQMTRSFAVEVNMDSSDLTGITYLRWERMQYKDVERLQLEWLMDDDVSGDDWVTAYYFDYEGTEYFMLDARVHIEDGETDVLATPQFDADYTSYWFVE